MRCPICKSNEVVNIPSSTMCIDNRTDCFIGADTKVPKEIMKKTFINKKYL